MSTDQIITRLAEQAVPLRPARRPLAQFALAAALSAIYVALLLAFEGVRPDLAAALARPMFAGELALLAALGLSALGSAILLGAPDLYQRRRVALLPVALFLLFAAFLAAGWLADPHSPPPWPGMECLSCISLFAAAPAIALFVAIRRRATTHAGAAGSVALLAGFAIGALALRLSEETFSMPHVVLWHYLPMIGVAAIGLVLGRLFLRW